MKSQSIHRMHLHNHCSCNVHSIKKTFDVCSFTSMSIYLLFFALEPLALLFHSISVSPRGYFHRPGHCLFSHQLVKSWNMNKKRNAPHSDCHRPSDSTPRYSKTIEWKMPSHLLSCILDGNKKIEVKLCLLLLPCPLTLSPATIA